ncbi:uncharacterized protein SPAPADRAFT_63734, partial [Spathaspora passalidarum NRRL Y-27907]
MELQGIVSDMNRNQITSAQLEQQYGANNVAIEITDSDEDYQYNSEDDALDSEEDGLEFEEYEYDSEDDAIDLQEGFLDSEDDGFDLEQDYLDQNVDQQPDPFAAHDLDSYQEQQRDIVASHDPVIEINQQEGIIRLMNSVIRIFCPQIWTLFNDNLGLQPVAHETCLIIIIMIVVGFILRIVLFYDFKTSIETIYTKLYPMCEVMAYKINYPDSVVRSCYHKYLSDGAPLAKINIYWSSMNKALLNCLEEGNREFDVSPPLPRIEIMFPKKILEHALRMCFLENSKCVGSLF